METFKITEAHIKLAQSMYVSWGYSEAGAPAIDSKRPYGNGDVYRDMMRILGLPEVEDVPETLRDYLDKLHESMQTALQIFLTTLSFKEGEYEKAETYNYRSWKKKIINN